MVVVATAAGFTAAIGPVGASAAGRPAASGAVSTSETTMGYDNQRTNWDDAEPGLRPSSVKAKDFGQIFDTTLPGTTSTKPNQIYAQPIVADGLTIVATEDDYVAALRTADGPDGKAGSIAWDNKTLGTPWTPQNCSNLVPHVGITGTPVYDPATDAIYLAAKTAAAGGTATYKLHALSARTGQELSGWPVTLAGKSINGGQTFNATTANQRTALLLMNGSVYLGFASHCDHGPYVGFVIGVDTTTAAHPQSLWAAEARASDSEAGIWQSGGGLIADGANDILLTTGNGISPPKLPGRTPPDTLAESVVRLHVDGNKHMSATDFFSPANNAKLDQEDADLGSGAPLSLPDAFGTTKYPHLLVQDGKDGVVRLLDRDNLGGNAQGPGGTDADLAELQLNGLWGRFAAFPSSTGNYLFLTPRKAPLTALSVGSDKGGNPSLSVRTTSTDIYPYNSGSPIVTSDGTDASSAVVWVVQCDFGTGAHAYLKGYAMPGGAGTAWQPLVSFSLGTVAQYVQPATANGRLFVGSRDGHVMAYGRPLASALNAPSTEFDEQPVGQPSAPRNVTISATKDVTVEKITTSAPFSVDTSGFTPNTALKAGHSITVPVTFAPTDTGTVTQDLAVTARAAGATVDDEYDFGLHGTGTRDGLSADPGSLAFGNVNVGESKELSTLVTNTGATTATIQTGTDPTADGPFSVRTEPVSGDTLDPQKSVSVTVRFTPTDVTHSQDSLVIRADTGTVTIPLTGDGFDGVAHASFDHTALDFGNVPLGGSKTLSFTITNDGTATLVLTKAPPPTAPFSAPRIEGQELAPGDELTVDVTYTPTTAQASTDGYFVNGDNDQGPTTVAVTGNEQPWTGPITSPLGCAYVQGSAPGNAVPIVGQRCFSATAEQYTVDPATHTLHYGVRTSPWCIDVAGAHRSNGTKVQLYHCNNGVAQQWYWRADDSLYNPNSGKCLDMPGSKIRVQLQLYTCNRTNAQYWDLAGLQAARGAISSTVAPVNAVCLDVYHARTADTTPVQTYGCNRGVAQRITQVGTTLRVLGSCVDVRYNGTANGTPVWLYRCNGGTAQQWTERPNGVLYNPHSGKCLDVPHTTTKPGTQLQIYTCHGGAAQSWNLPA